VLALVDVPMADAVVHASNAELMGHPVVLPVGLLESMLPQTRAWVASARVDDAGLRVIDAVAVDPEALTIGDLAAQLSGRLAHVPEAWHFWHLWPRFLAKQPGNAAEPRMPGQ
jgi:hypothetical protein